MLRFIYVILMNLFRAPYIIPKMRKWADHPENIRKKNDINWFVMSFI